MFWNNIEHNYKKYYLSLFFEYNNNNLQFIDFFNCIWWCNTLYKPVLLLVRKTAALKYSIYYLALMYAILQFTICFPLQMTAIGYFNW